MIRPLKEFLRLNGLSNNAFAASIGTTHQNVGNWLKADNAVCYVEFSPDTNAVTKVTLETVKVVYQEKAA